MQLATILHNDEVRIGARRRDGRLALLEFPSMRNLIELGQDGLARARGVSDAGGAVIDLPDVEAWLPPVPDPGKVLGVAMNNSASNERKISAPEHPAFFLKPGSCLIGHGAEIRIRQYYGSVHPEPELAVVIGATTRDVAAADALDAVFGYTIMNDLTGNDMRADDLFHYWALYADDAAEGGLARREQHLSYAARYKGCDTFGCMGPWLTTMDEIDDPDDLGVFCSVGGEPVAEDNTRYYNYRIAELISYISHYQTLEPGDVISCGTAFRPSANRASIHQADLQHVSGPVEIRIDGLGTLINPVVIERKPLGRWRLAEESPAEDFP